MRNLEHKKILIVGAGRGIGKATALACAEAGADLLLCSRKASELRAVAEECHRRGGRACYKLCDVTNFHQIEEIARAMPQEGFYPDALVYCAGVGWFGPTETFEIDLWEKTLAVNLTGAFLWARALLPLFLERSSGHLLFVGSIAVRVSFPQSAAYVASKTGLAGFVQSLSAEYRKRGIRTTLVIPGATNTPFWDQIPNPPDRLRMLKPEEVAGAILYALTQPPSVSVEEVVILPQEGIL